MSFPAEWKTWVICGEAKTTTSCGFSQAGMISMNPTSMRSVRPTTTSFNEVSGPAGGVGKRGRGDRRVGLCSTYSRPVHPVAEVNGNEDE